MNTTSDADLFTKRVHLVTALGALLGCLVAVLWMIGPYLLALFLGGTAAMLAYPLQRWLRARRGPGVAAAAVTTLVLLLVVAPLTGCAIVAVKQAVAIGRQLSELKELSLREVTAALNRWDAVRMAVGDPGSVDLRLKSAIRTAGHFMSGLVVSLGRGAPDFLLQAALSVIAFFFFLRDGERFMEWILGLNVFDRELQTRLAESFRETAASTVLAGFAAAATQAALISIGFLILGVPGAFLAGGATFVFAWIPALGTLPASLAGSLYLYAQGEPVKMGVMIALALAASFSDNLIRLLVLNGRIGVHPLVGIVAIVGGIKMFGMLGVFIGPIMAATLLALLRTWPVIAGRFGAVISGRDARGRE